MRISLGLIALALGVAAGPTPAAPVTPVARQLTDLERRQQATAIETFETRYLEARKDEWHFHNTSLKLVGFQRADLDEIDIDEIETLLKNDPEMTAKFEAEGAHYDFLARQVRVYFPVRDALVYHKRELVEANERGELPHKRVDGDMSIVGRFQSESVAGDASNVIRDGIVYLSAAHPVLHMRGNVHFYDFGTKRGHDHAHDHKRRYPDGIEDPNKGCYANHYNKICTFAYPSVKQDRCGTAKRSERKCRDYNGWWPLTSCGSKSKKGFMGSDCYYALKKGHCWNEAVKGTLGGH